MQNMLNRFIVEVNDDFDMTINEQKKNNGTLL